MVLVAKAQRHELKRRLIQVDALLLRNAPPDVRGIIMGIYKNQRTHVVFQHQVILKDMIFCRERNLHAP